MDAALILIDFQIGFENPVWGELSNPGFEAQAARLLEAWRKAGAPLAHIRHLSTAPDSPLSGNGAEWLHALAPRRFETRFEKTVNSAFIGTGLETWLRERGVTALVIAGLTTPHCVSTTCRMGANLGFAITLAHDACAAFAANADESWQTDPLDRMTPETIHRSAINHLHGEFVTARTVTDILRS